MGDCDPAVAGMVAITGIVREVMARPGVWPPRRFPGLSVNVELRHSFAAPLTKTSSQGIGSLPHTRRRDAGDHKAVLRSGAP
jgi:hypothetical protein